MRASCCASERDVRSASKSRLRSNAPRGGARDLLRELEVVVENACAWSKNTRTSSACSPRTGIASSELNDASRQSSPKPVVVLDVGRREHVPVLGGVRERLRNRQLANLGP